jgi:UDP:flavonoid glycosyltransferase YjiC (YdhE family)
MRAARCVTGTWSSDVAERGRRIVLLASGTRGDVQPYLALARALTARGDAPVVATHAAFEPLARAAGVATRALADNPSDWLAQHTTTLGPAAPLASLQFVRAARPMLARLIDSAWAACADADVIVAGLPTLFAGGIADALRIPIVWGLLQPLTPTRAFACSVWTGPRVAPLRSYALADAAMWLPWRGVTNRWRRSHGLAARGRDGYLREIHARQQPVLYGFSTALVPRPADWPAHVRTTGFWRLETSEALPADVSAACERGAFYIGSGAGSAVVPGVLLACAADAARRSALTGLINLHGVDVLPADYADCLMLCRDIAHSALFPRVRAVVHHGGAGTSAAVAHAGVPSLVLPAFADQQFWAACAVHAGSALSIDPRRLSAASLTALLNRVLTDTSLRVRADALARQLAVERGAEAAAGEV